MRISKLAQRQAKQMFRKCFVDETLDASRVREVVRGVIDSKPRSYLAVLQYFQRLVKLEIDRQTARVESAAPMSPDLKEATLQQLRRIYGPNLQVNFFQNPALIGGMRIRVGSDVYEGSIESRLARLGDRF